MTSTSSLQNYFFYFAAEIFLSGPGNDVALKATLKTQAAIVAFGLIILCKERGAGDFT